MDPRGFAHSRAGLGIILDLAQQAGCRKSRLGHYRLAAHRHSVDCVGATVGFIGAVQAASCAGPLSIYRAISLPHANTQVITPCHPAG